MLWLLAALGGVAAAGLGWAWFEAGWVRLRTIEVPLDGLPPELDGLRIVHLSDFHLGMPSRGSRAVRRAVEWTIERDPDLTALTGDLLSRRTARDRLMELVATLPRCYAVLGNHDYAMSRDPFSEASPIPSLRGATLLRDESRTLELRGRRVQIAGVDARSYHLRRIKPETLVDRDADFRILLCHFPNAVNKINPGAFDLVLAGHLHAGQITLPLPGGRRLPLAHIRERDIQGLFRRPAATLHISAGLGTTFVPFRFCARPEATELVLVQSR